MHLTGTESKGERGSSAFEDRKFNILLSRLNRINRPKK